MDAKIYGILRYEDEYQGFVYQYWNLTILPNKIKMDNNHDKEILKEHFFDAFLVY